MLKEQELDQFLDEFLDAGSTPVVQEEKEDHDLEEYTLPSDGLIIRQMKKDGKVSRRTWLAIVLLLLIVPVLLYISVRIFHGRKYLLCSLILVVAAMLPFFMMFEGRKPKAKSKRNYGHIGAGCNRRCRACSILYVSELQTGRGNCNSYRGFLWWRSRIPGRMYDYAAVQYVYGTGTVDTMADVCFWPDRFSCRHIISRGDFESTESRSLCIWIFERIFDLWGNHESGRSTDVLWIYNKREPDRELYFGRTGRSGPCSIYCDLFMGFKQTASRKAGTDQTQIRTDPGLIRPKAFRL